jgi:D-sedoheptulose 7-phosphate isomerase
MDTLTYETTIAWVEEQVDEAGRVQQAVRTMAPLLTELAHRMADVLSAGGQVFLFGNGGSAADAQHWAAELSGRFYRSRASLPAVALSTNTSQITAIANDYGYDEVFARPLAGMGRPGDMAVGISTSGRSANVVKALEAGRATGLVTVGFTGPSGGTMAACCDYLVSIPSADVARIQEGHELCGHVVCAIVERLLFPDPSEPALAQHPAP